MSVDHYFLRELLASPVYHVLSICRGAHQGCHKTKYQDNLLQYMAFFSVSDMVANVRKYRDVIYKLLGFTAAMIVAPIGIYFLTVDAIFRGKLLSLRRI